MLRRSLRTQITTKVVAISAAAALLLGTALVVLIVAVIGQRDAARTAFRSQQALSLANQLEKSLLSIETGLNRYVTTEEEVPYLRRVRRDLAQYPAQVARLVDLVSDDPGQQRRVRALAERISDYDLIWARGLIQIVDEDGFPHARSQVKTDGGRSLLDEIRVQFERLFDRERAVIRARERSAEGLSSRAIGLGLGGLGLVLAVAAGFTLYLRRSVLRPVRTVAEATGRLAAGDLSTRVPDQREDELGELARGFNSMADSLERGRSELERSNAELTRSNAELEQFASVTSHDLQAPLTTISMYTELLERRRGANGAAGGNGGAGELDLVEGIRGATQQARGLIRDLLEYSRAGRGQLTLEAVPAADIVEQALHAVAGAIEETHAQVTVGELPVVLADRGNICRVFQNLVGNAVKFTGGRKPVVSIDAERDGEHWRLAVRDNGIGMDPEHARRIFEPFQRLHGEEDYPGTGIGLAVCERIIDQHGGRIWVESRPGEGSVFLFTLPAATTARTEPPRVGASA